MVSTILAKIAAGAAGLAFTALSARLAIKVANKLNWEPIYAATENACAAVSRLMNMRFTAPFWEPIEEFLQEKLRTLGARAMKGFDRDDKGGADAEKALPKA